MKFSHCHTTCINTQVVIFTINTLYHYFLIQISSFVYLKLFLLCEAFCALSCGVANKCHYSNNWTEPGKHFCNFLHAISKWWEDHHSGIHSVHRCAFIRDLIYLILKSQKSIFMHDFKITTNKKGEVIPQTIHSQLSSHLMGRFFQRHFV